MKIYSLFIAISLVLCACKNTDNGFETAYDVFPKTMGEWNRIKIPGDEVVNAVFGNVDDTLVVMTSYNLYFSTDQGRSWTHTFEANQGLSTLYYKSDTLVAYAGWHRQMLEGVPGVAYQESGMSPFVYSTDNGQTWNYKVPIHFRDIYPPIGYVEDTKRDVVYRIKDIYKELEYSSSKELEYNVILKECSNNLAHVDFPIQSYIENLYIDETDRLYVCLGHYWKYYKEVGEGKVIVENPGVIYYIDLKDLR